MEDEVKRTKELNDKYEKIYNEKYAGKNLHEQSAPETRERLAILETSQKLFMEENRKEHEEIKISMTDFHSAMLESMKEMNIKLDKAIEEKADKDSVNILGEQVENLKTDALIWRTRFIVVGSVLLFLVTFFKEPLLELIKKL